MGVSSLKSRLRTAEFWSAESLEHVMAGELHGQVTSEPIGRLYKDRLCAVGCQPLNISAKPGR